MALISDSRPNDQQWLDLLQNGELSSKEHSPSPKGAPGPMIYSRVSGVQQGTRWSGVLTSPGRSNLEVTTQPISWPIASLQRGTLGTGQVQSAQLTGFYPAQPGKPTAITASNTTSACPCATPATAHKPWIYGWNHR